MLTNMLEERRANPRKVKSDFFDYVLEELDRGDTILTEAIALDLMFVLLFANLWNNFTGHNSSCQASDRESSGIAETNV